jgi:prephenate dehydrogenase
MLQLLSSHLYFENVLLDASVVPHIDDLETMIEKLVSCGYRISGESLDELDTQAVEIYRDICRKFASPKE